MNRRPTAPRARRVLFATLLAATSLAVTVGSAKPRGAVGAPEIRYSTYLSSDSNDNVTDVAVDGQGDVYVVGLTNGHDFPVRGGGRPDPDPLYADAFVAKFRPSAGGDASLVFATYLGGDDADVATSVAVDPDGNVYVAGTTFSSDFPSTKDIHGETPGPGGQAFVVKLSPTGSVLYSTTFGGSNVETASGVAVDARGNAYLTGYTLSSDFPVVRPIMDVPGGLYAQNAFVAKLDAAGDAFVYSTYVGGTYPDSGRVIAVDDDGAAYVLATTYSEDFPLTTRFVPLSNGFATNVLLKVDAAGDRLEYSDSLDFGEVNGLAVGDDGSVYLGGSVYPARPPDGHEPKSDGIIRKIDPTGATVDSSVLVATDGVDRVLDLARDRSGNLYVTGVTDSDAFTNVSGLDAFTKPADGRYSLEGFLTKLSPDAGEIEFSTYLGGTENDTPSAVSVDSDENVYVVGDTDSSDFPVVRAFQASADVPAFPHGFVTAIATRTTVPPPVLARVDVLAGSGKPFRLRVEGENLSPTAGVFVGADATPWPDVRATAKGLVLGTGRALKDRFPRGVAVPIRVVNPDGGSATVTFTR